MTITSAEVEATPQAAQVAYKRAKSLLGVWAPLVRAIARNQKLKVELTGGAPCTDGKTVFLRVPLGLAYNKHEKLLCGKWDAEANGYLCPACNAELECDVSLFHEVAHLLAGTFDHQDPDQELIDLMKVCWPSSSHRFDRVALSIKGTGARRNNSNTLVQRIAAVLPDQWGFFTFNVVEDLFVNASIIEARPGLALIFDSSTEAILRDGVEQLDGSITKWGEQHSFMQALLAWSLIASNQSRLCVHLDNDVVTKVASNATLRDLGASITDQRKVMNRFKVAFKVLLTLQELGLGPEKPNKGLSKPPPEDEDKAGESGEEDQTSESGDSDEASGGSPEEGDDDTQGAPAPTGQSDEDDESDADDQSGEGGSDDDDEDGSSDESETEVQTSGSGDATDEGEAEDEASENGKSEESDDPADEAVEGDAHSAGKSATSGSSKDESSGDELDSDSSDEGSPAKAPTSGKPSNADFDDFSPSDVSADPEAETAEGDEAETELDMEVAKKAFEKLTGHESFGDVDALEDAFGQPKEEDLDPVETELIKTAVSFDGLIESDTVGINKIITEGHTFQWCGRGAKYIVLDERFVQGDYSMPVEVRVAAASAVRRAFTANKKAGLTRDLRSGRKLDSRTMGPRIATGDDRIFARRNVPTRVDWTVLMGIDISGSTYSGALEVEKAIAIGVGDLLTEIGIPFSVYAHTATMDKGASHYQLIVLPLNSVGGSWQQGRKVVGSLQPGLENLDGHTMQVYRKLLERQPGKDKLLMYFTDGEMPAANPTEERAVLKNETAILRAKGIHAVGVGVGTDSPKKFGLDTIVVNTIEDVPNLVKGIGERLSRPVG